MARIRPIDSHDAPAIEEVFQIKLDTLGFVPNSAFTIARWPELARAYGQLSKAVTTRRHISGELASLIFLMASTAAGCQYCQAHSASTALNRGADERKLSNVWAFEESDLFDEKERAALRLAEAAGHAPSRVTDGHFAALRKHYGEEAIIEMVGVIAFSGFMNRWNATIATDLESEPAAAAAKTLAHQGWTIGAHGGE